MALRHSHEVLGPVVAHCAADRVHSCVLVRPRSEGQEVAARAHHPHALQCEVGGIMHS